MKVILQAIVVSVLLNWTADGAVADEVLLTRPPNASDIAQGLRSNLQYEAPLQQAADGFSLKDSSILTGIGWWGFYLPSGALETPPQVQFEIRMFTGQAGKPSANPFYKTTVLASVSPFIAIQNHPTYAFSAQLIVPFEAQAQTGYWLSVVESDVRTDGAFAWFNSGPSQWPMGFVTRDGDGENWAVPENVEHLSFSLSGSIVPEPSVLALLALSAVIMLFRGQRN